MSFSNKEKALVGAFSGHCDSSKQCSQKEQSTNSPLIVVAGAVVRTSHLAVTGVEVAAVAQGEAVGGVGAQEISAFGLKIRRMRNR